MESQAQRPIPDLEPQKLNVWQYEAFTPEKLELIGGYLAGPADWTEERIDLLQLLLANVGLEQTVRLAPEAAWREAIRRVYG